MGYDPSVLERRIAAQYAEFQKARAAFTGKDERLARYGLPRVSDPGGTLAPMPFGDRLAAEAAITANAAVIEALNGALAAQNAALRADEAGAGARVDAGIRAYAESVRPHACSYCGGECPPPGFCASCGEVG